MPDAVDERVALALAALAEVTDPDDVGALLDAEVVEPGVVDLRFACNLPGYAAWRWTVSTTDLPDTTPTVLEVELLPGDDALLAPPWVPWTERLAEWRKQHPDEQHPGETDDADESEDPEDDEDAELDEDDLAVDDELDELDETELEGALSPEEAEQDAGDVSDEDDDSDEDEDEDEDDSDDDGFVDEERDPDEEHLREL